MSNRELLVGSLLLDIQNSIELILKRFSFINSADDFLKDEKGLEKLDSISMRLIAIGEGLKNIDKLTNRDLLPQYQQIDWRGVKGIRDILSHHYFDLDAEIIYDICKNRLPPLLEVTNTIVDRFKNEK